MPIVLMVRFLAVGISFEQRRVLLNLPVIRYIVLIRVALAAGFVFNPRSAGVDDFLPEAGRMNGDVLDASEAVPNAARSASVPSPRYGGPAVAPLPGVRLSTV